MDDAMNNQPPKDATSTPQARQSVSHTHATTVAARPPIQSSRNRRIVEDEPPKLGIFSRIFYAIIAGFFGVLIGGFFDVVIGIVRSLLSIGNGGIYWMFYAIIGGVAALFGLIFGYRAGDLLINIFGFYQNDEPVDSLDEAQLSTGIIRAIAFGLFLSFVVWFILMIMA